MAKLTRDIVVAEALDLLDEVGIDMITTRHLARRLGVEQPALYWHFRNKAALLEAMAGAAMEPHATKPLPEPRDDWRRWFMDNMRSFRTTLLMHRDGARLHAGSPPRATDTPRLIRKLVFLIDAGFTEEQATMGMLAAGRFTLGCAMEEQNDIDRGGAIASVMDHTVAFESGLTILVDGLALRRGR